MKKFPACLILVLVLVACGKSDDKTSVTSDSTASTSSAGSTSRADTAQRASSTPAGEPGTPAVLDTFARSGNDVVFDARRDIDVTGDGKADVVSIHAIGPRTDSMAVRLSILSETGDTLFADGWNTRLYFIYVSRSKFTATAADSVVLMHLKALTASKAFTTSGPSPQLRKTNARTGGIDRDAIRYDIKEQGVRTALHIPRGTPLTIAALNAQEKFVVSDASIDSLAAELKNKPTFTYFAGGEVTNTIAWSDIKHRFVRIFSCC